MSCLIILGAESLGREVADIALTAGKHESVQFLDDAVHEPVMGLPVAGGFDRIPALVGADTSFFVAVGRVEARARWMREVLQRGGSLATVIHPGACVSRFAAVGANNMIDYGCHIGANTVVGDGNLFWSSSVVSHDCSVGDLCFFGPGVHVGGYTRIGSRSMFGTGSSVRSCIEIGSSVIVGLGARVTSAIGDAHFVKERSSDATPIRGKPGEDIYFGH